MKGKRYSMEEKIRILREVDSGKSIQEHAESPSPCMIRSKLIRRCRRPGYWASLTRWE